MKVTMNTKLAVAVLAHMSTRVAADRHIRFTDETSGLVEPVLTTVSEGAIGLPIPTDAFDGVVVLETSVCRAVTSTVCETFEVISQVTPSMVDITTTPVVATPVVTEPVGITVSDKVSTSVGHSSTAQKSTATAESSSIVTPVPTSGAEKKDSEGAGILAGLALLLVI
ncbi:uncharacterized protein CTRU02_209121 [Colletotrichum truncatum]|uniref:Uncharacterized protein n=1 Tax=Colletotrichum truncatum TaxID=5467 RepID=A0ACC3YY96_COLTU|nr:uncharacterized protein CTRU02_07688 [Colletotrichum truncatum]KAF6790782.1 hypothetical protein CTRU02_07688 [Colletotrichum truncatum]